MTLIFRRFGGSFLVKFAVWMSKKSSLLGVYISFNLLLLFGIFLPISILNKEIFWRNSFEDEGKAVPAFDVSSYFQSQLIHPLIQIYCIYAGTF